MRRRSTRAGLALLLCVGLPLSASAVETNVYGDPGSGNYSAAMAVVQDPESGRVFTMGVFFGTFQGIASSQWDLWMAEVHSNGQLGWVTTWDAPELDGVDFSAIDQGLPAWPNPPVDLVVGADGTLIGSVIAGGGTTIVQASPDGSDGGHTPLDFGGGFEGQLVGGESPGLIGWTSEVDPVIRRVGLDGTEVWSVDPWADGRAGPLIVKGDGSFVAGIQLDRLNFQNAAANLGGFDSDGNQMWETVLNARCFAHGDVGLLELGSELGVLVEPPREGNPSSCDVDKKFVASLDGTTGELVANRTLKDTLNILWCDDPREGVLTDPLETGFTDGDECGGDPVYWTDVNWPLISTGSEIEGLAIVGLEQVGQGYFGYGILRTEVSGNRWNLAEFEYFAPASGMMPYDMIVTESGPLIVGRAYNTTWIGGSTSLQSQGTELDLAASSTGAAVLVSSGLEVSGRFLDDNGNTFEADIEWLESQGITKGCNPPTNSEYCPDDLVTRGQMAAFLHRALAGVLTPSQAVDFVDDDGNTFEADIEWLGGTGVTKGCNPPTNDRYCPNDLVTRGQMAAFLVRALGYTDNGGGNLFVDDDGDTFEADIDKLGTAGVTKGCNPPTNDRFCPNDFVTRGQMAAFLHRALSG